MISFPRHWWYVCQLVFVQVLYAHFAVLPQSSPVRLSFLFLLYLDFFFFTWYPLQPLLDQKKWIFHRVSFYWKKTVITVVESKQCQIALSDIVWAELDLHVLFIKQFAARTNAGSSVDPDIWRHEDAWCVLIGRSLQEAWGGFKSMVLINLITLRSEVKCFLCLPQKSFAIFISFLLIHVPLFKIACLV